jgi:hypothetical protein
MHSPETPPFAGLRVIHAASYHMDKDGASFFGCDLKFHQGMVQAGCLVVPFSINDRARMLTFTNSKTFGTGKANKALVRTCVNVRPDALIIGHGQSISRTTLLAIRDSIPDLKIGYWYVDPLWEPKDVDHLHERADLFDAICCTTGGPLLSVLPAKNPGGVCSESGGRRHRASASLRMCGSGT